MKKHYKNSYNNSYKEKAFKYGDIYIYLIIFDFIYI